jgi:hypothetical protein
MYELPLVVILFGRLQALELSFLHATEPDKPILFRRLMLRALFDTTT